MDIEVTFPGGQRVDATFDGLTLRTDTAVESGGEGTAHSPFGVFLASVGCCVGKTMLDFCQHRGIPMAGIRLREAVEFHPETHLAAGIRFELTLPPKFPERYVQPLLRATKACTVKKHLETPPAISTLISRSS